MNISRYIPAGYTVLKQTEHGVVYRSQHDGSPIAIAYAGKRKDSAWHYRFNSEERMIEKTEEFLAGLQAWEDRKFLRKLERRAKAGQVEVGDIFSNAWGYDQTNVEFYQVIAKTNGTFTIQEIAQRSLGEAPSGPMSDYVTPVKDVFLKDSKPMVKTSLNMKHGCLSPVAPGAKVFSSWYA